MTIEKNPFPQIQKLSNEDLIHILIAFNKRKLSINGDDEDFLKAVMDCLRERMKL